MQVLVPGASPRLTLIASAPFARPCDTLEVVPENPNDEARRDLPEPSEINWAAIEPQSPPPRRRKKPKSSRARRSLASTFVKMVSVPEARAHFGELLRRVSGGESIRITRRSVPVARLVPAYGHGKRDLRKIGRDIRQIREGISLKGLTIRQLIDEGRRY